jgi:hypothetical protein
MTASGREQGVRVGDVEHAVAADGEASGMAARARHVDMPGRAARLEIVQLFDRGAGFRQSSLGPGVIGRLAASTPDGIWLGTYEDGPGRLFHFTAATLARLSDGETLKASQAATVLTIPDHAQGGAIGGGGYGSRSDWNWGTLDRLDPVTGAPLRRYKIAPGTEGLAFGNADRLWAVSEAGSRHIYDHPFLGLLEPFFPVVFALDLSLGVRRIDVPPAAVRWDRRFESGSIQRRVQCETIRSRKREYKPAAEVRRSVPQIVQRAMIEVLKAMYEEDFPWVAPELFDVVQARPRGAAKWAGGQARSAASRRSG